MNSRFKIIWCLFEYWDQMGGMGSLVSDTILGTINTIPEIYKWLQILLTNMELNPCQHGPTRRLCW